MPDQMEVEPVAAAENRLDEPSKLNNPFLALYDMIIEKNFGAMEVPVSLFHYVSSEGLKGIVENHNIRFSNATFLNDGSESFHGVQIARLMIAEYMKDKPDEEQEISLRLIEVIAQGMLQLQPIVFCMSAGGNLLNQWRDYGRDVVPYSIELDTIEIQKWMSFNFPIFLTPIIYDLDIQKRLVTELYDATYRRAKEMEENGNITQENLDSLLLSAAAGFCMLACRMKNYGFSAEQEWRLIVFESDIPSEVKPNFRTSVLGVVPFYEWKKKDDPKQLPINSVMVGPSPYGQVSDLALKQFLKHNGYDVPTHYSTIPIRR